MLHIDDEREEEATCENCKHYRGRKGVLCEGFVYGGKYIEDRYICEKWDKAVYNADPCDDWEEKDA